jgi:glucose-6-phosphate isomerase
MAIESSDRDVRILGPGRLAPELDRALDDLDKEAVVRRIWDHDWTVWKAEDKEISNRLGWLSSPDAAEEDVPAWEAFAGSVRGDGLVHAVVLGMGGSSLAPEAFARSFATAPGALGLEILDTTEPGTVAEAAGRIDLRKTLFLVSSKSGTTAELLALLSFFYDRARRELGEGLAGSRFVAITDPGTPLEALAESLRFRRVFHGRPDIGGRFSALSEFGLLPAVLKGIDLRRLLAPARAMAEACRLEAAADNPGALLGAVLGTAATKGLDKLTLFAPPRLEPLAGWIEQLVAESTGKEGRGMVPVIESGPGHAGSYGQDRLFVGFLSGLDTEPGEGGRALVDRGAPFIRLSLDDPYSLAGHFFLWEFATAVAAHIMKINPFDQPDVESTKRKTREVLAGVARAGTAAAGGRPAGSDGLRVAGPASQASPLDAVARFLDGRRDGDYLALLAFLPKCPKTEGLVAGLAEGLRRKTRLPVTVGFGPRYLHSTGQLHKGDSNRGLFLMLVPSDVSELEIPAVTGIVRPASDFGGLFLAQAKGDGLALAEKGRRVLTVELSSPVEAGIGELASLLA